MNGENLLVLDTEEETCESVKLALAGEGYSVCCSRSGIEAISIVRDRNIDLLISDLSTRDLDPVHLIRQCCLMKPSLGVVVMSRNEPKDLIIRSFQAGAQAFLCKPLNSQELGKVVDEILTRNRLVEENARLNTLLPLVELGKSGTPDFNAHKTLYKLLRLACVETQADQAYIVLMNETRNELVVREGIGLPRGMVNKRLPMSDEDIHWFVVKTGKATVLNNKDGQSAEYENSVATSVSCVPLIVKGRVIGVIACTKSFPKTPLNDKDLELLSILAGQAAMAMENTMLLNMVKEQRGDADFFLRKCLDAQEDERRRISAELHDDLAQKMVATLYSIQTGIAQLNLKKIDLSKGELTRAKTMVDASIKELRRIILDLHPTALAELGLIEASRRYLESFVKETGTRGSFEIEGHSRSLSLTQDVIVYRVLTEALTNVRKHAEASKVDVVFTFEPKYFSMEVADNGRGFNLTEALKNRVTGGMLGLVTMKERAEMVGGQLSVETAPGIGTRISLKIPISVHSK